ncbi:MAG: ABC transporter permease [Steroidobacteraceae bacterium]
MSASRQILAITAVALKSLPRRIGTSLVVVVGVAAVVAVLVAALAVARGFTRAAAKTGSPGRAIVLAGDTESSSGISRAAAATIMDAPGVAQTATGRPIASAEALEFIPLTDEHTGLDAYATVRGVGPEASALRPEVRLVAGRMFKPGEHEVIVGRAVEERLGGLGLGRSITLPNGAWTVVGVFTSGGDSHESEILTDAASLMNAYRHNEFNSVTVKLGGPRDFERFNAALTSNPTLSVKAQREVDYFAAMSRPVSRLLEIIAYGIGAIMAFGAVFGALNTMYSAVSARRTEIATLRAIGFGGASVVVSVVIEALVLGLAGAGLGSLVAWSLLNGATVSTMTGVTPSQLTFGLAVGPGIVLIGVLFALGIAVVAGICAASRASRISVADAMRVV